MLHKIKSEHYRLGDQRVKYMVHWPYEFCSVGQNFKMSTDFNIYEWVQGFSRCILEETDPQTGMFMLQYQSNLMQDAIELNWTTDKRVHPAVLTETKRGTQTGMTSRRWQDMAVLHPAGHENTV